MPRRQPLSSLEAQAREGRTPGEALEWLRGVLKGDPREAARRLILRLEKQTLRTQKEAQRLHSLLAHERNAYGMGAGRVAGVDEAGRGPLAGPVVAAAVILPADWNPSPLKGLDDSKKLTSMKREGLLPIIQGVALALGVGQASAEEIDRFNIYRASQMAMERAIQALSPQPDFIITDAMPLPSLSRLPQNPLVHGDALSLSVAAASVVAKVTRDRLMEELDGKHPGYGFRKHKGYGTADHLEALRERGPCPDHRRSFAPVRIALEKGI